jgi:DNA-directed RNA polymerase beta subunit
MFNGFTGEQLSSRIFIGPTFYQRLKHMVEDKVHSRATGPCMMLTRQPAEGRARDGGLRFGEMERDCILSHRISIFLKERMHDLSDGFRLSISDKSGLPVAINREKGLVNMLTNTSSTSKAVRFARSKKQNDSKGDAGAEDPLEDSEGEKEEDFVDISILYCMKLLLQELGSMGIAGRLRTTVPNKT